MVQDWLSRNFRFCRAQGTTKGFSEAWPRTGINIAITCLLYLKIKNEDPLVKQSFLRSLDIHSSSKKLSFDSKLMEMSECLNLIHFNTDLLDTAKIKHLSALLKHFILATNSSTLSKTRIFLYLFILNQICPFTLLVPN